MKYKLLKELPDRNIGDLVHFYDGNYAKLNLPDGTCIPQGPAWFWVDKKEDKPSKILFPNYWQVCPYNVDTLPEWFEPVCEWPKSWCELQKIKGFHIDEDSVINTTNFDSNHSVYQNTFATKAQAKSALAFAMLSQLAKVMNDGWEPDWLKHGENKFTIVHRLELLIEINRNQVTQIVFKTKEMAEFSLENHEGLWKDYWMI